MQAMNSHFLQVPLCDLTDYVKSVLMTLTNHAKSRKLLKNTQHER